MGSHRVGHDRSLTSLLAESSRTVTIFQSPLYPENVVESDHGAPADLGGEEGSLQKAVRFPQPQAVPIAEATSVWLSSGGKAAAHPGPQSIPSRGISPDLVLLKAARESL